LIRDLLKIKFSIPPDRR